MRMAAKYEWQQQLTAKTWVDDQHIEVVVCKMIGEFTQDEQQIVQNYEW